MVKTIIIFFLISVFYYSTNAQEQNDFFKTIVIDAGHGGKDPGAVGKIVMEKDVVLGIALKLGQYINENLPGINVIYTRKKDVFVPLDERAQIANSSKADLFISIHANSISNPNISGTETFVLGLHRSQDNLEVAKKENSVIVLEDDYTTKYEGFDPNVSESYIIFELMQNVYLDQSIKLASLVEDQFNTRAGRRSRGVKQAGFLVLRETAMPSVLVEAGFLTNNKEEAYIATDEGQAIIASAIYRAIKEYKKSFELKSNIVISNNEPSPISFRIQIASSKRKLKDDSKLFFGFQDVWMYNEADYFKYTIEYSKSFNDLKPVLLKIKEKIPDAFIVAFENDKRIPIDKALKLINP
ncbi:MAG: N-acetylmuramoyl-L-alanine amidase [Marinilabiliaceae bacterium]|nr:N-acetylmuramoyl-L-alanine amidase [Marinilabiliaceae bacterium]